LRFRGYNSRRQQKYPAQIEAWRLRGEIAQADSGERGLFCGFNICKTGRTGAGGSCWQNNHGRVSGAARVDIFAGSRQDDKMIAITYQQVQSKKMDKKKKKKKKTNLRWVFA